MKPQPISSSKRKQILDSLRSTISRASRRSEKFNYAQVSEGDNQLEMTEIVFPPSAKSQSERKGDSSSSPHASDSPSLSGDEHRKHQLSILSVESTSSEPSENDEGDELAMNSPFHSNLSTLESLKTSFAWNVTLKLSFPSFLYGLFFRLSRRVAYIVPYTRRCTVHTFFLPSSVRSTQKAHVRSYAFEKTVLLPSSI